MASAPLDLTGATLAQLTNWANSQARTATKAAEQPIVAQQGQTAADYAAHGKAIQGFATALGQLLGGIAPKIQDDYTQAANSQATFGKGFSDQLQGQVAQSNQNTNDFLSKMGAPAGALKAAPNVGDVAYGLGGYIPASTMNREGAAFGAAANLLPGNALAQGQQDFTANQYAASDANKTLVQQIAAIAAKQPALAQTALNSLEGTQVKQQSNQITARKNAVDEIVKYGVDPATGQLTPNASKAMEQLTGAAPGTFTGMSAANAITLSDHAQTLAVQKGALNERVSHDQAVERIAQQNANTAATRVNIAAANKFSPSSSKALGYRADQYGNPLGGKVRVLPGFGFNAAGDVVKVSAGGATRQHGLSAGQVNKAKGAALSLAQNLYQGIAKGKGPTAAWNAAHPNGLPPATYQQAVLEAQKEGQPAWIYLPALNSFYMPGGKNGQQAGPPAPGTP